MNAVLVTGSTGGIGQAICKKFKDNDYYVIGLDLDRNDSSDIHTDEFILADLGQIAVDKSRRAKLRETILSIIKRKQLRLVSLVNNAALQRLGPLESIEIEDWTDTMNVNVIAPFFMTQALIAPLTETMGSVINISSVHAVATKPGFSVYSTSKAALNGLSRAMAIDLGPKIRVNSICPAATETTMLKEGFKDKPKLYDTLNSFHPMERIAKPDEIAESVYFLSSDNASFITGSTFFVDGGILSRLHDPD